MRYKICPSCHTKNPEEEIVCKNCMADISDVEPVKEEQENRNIKEDSSEEESDKTIVIKESIVLLGDGFSIIVKDGDIVGRQGAGAEQLRKFKTVSRKHIKVYKQDDRWFIEDLDSTNGTYLNGELITPHEKYEIKNGDIINLSSQVALKVKL